MMQTLYGLKRVLLLGLIFSTSRSMNVRRAA